MEKLRECPFCGGIPAQDIIKDSYYRNRYTIECGNCGLQMWDIAKDSLHKSWNTRYEPKHETVEQWEEMEQFVRDFAVWWWEREDAADYGITLDKLKNKSSEIIEKLNDLHGKPNSIGER